MGEMYLVLHKVRGQPAFDVAERCEEPVGWIIPTSGHGVHPIASWKLDGLLKADLGQVMDVAPETLASVPDHYQITVEPKQPKQKLGAALLEQIGLTQTTTPFERRI